MPGPDSQWESGTARTGFTLPQNLLEAVETDAQARGLSKSSWLRRACRRYLSDDTTQPSTIEEQLTYHQEKVRELEDRLEGIEEEHDFPSHDEVLESAEREFRVRWDRLMKQKHSLAEGEPRHRAKSWFHDKPFEGVSKVEYDALAERVSGMRVFNTSKVEAEG